ncbi:efflux RND transporter periplasmic adaptor subunit [Rhodoplanes sp. TEM]|uniref:Efflux RND transporter periplasmic adaptor subunit n=1 Tax=Rhodoplanes tepidamans TaxID=200616 RepID=A0ABT5JBC2_RHOTP|nr:MULTISPECIES: efflux RND transporter periplasmic adaptor subunit [Rhodoplanes]MDC7786973.1 efflux RND transporter periplasmic adaptor subunit [Rhodoplanes tepidamans]MDC7985036.1 efflux RND transporter periplasmic adaptor subunit [Rhodoplanes sp. TEM]MDQ0355330.1 RND family efflux transporter MFP subunit [Rhodoplanes tepidamans]
MIRRRALWVIVAVLALAGSAFAVQWLGAEKNGARPARTATVPRAVAVETGTATRKKAPVTIEALGSVTPLASVAVRTRIDSEIVGIHFEDGAVVKKGDLLVTLDGRALEAQIRQAEAQLARDKAQLEGAERDLRRYTELVARAATPQTNLDNAKTQADVYRAAILASQATIDHLKVQLGYTSIRAPISGRISQANVKVGNLVRTGEATPIATINQMAPVYVSFTVPQRALPQIRAAMTNEDSAVEAVVPGESRRAHGQVAMVENAVDSATGMATIRAVMPNQDEILWPGTLVTAKLTLRIEDAVTVPATAVQVSQQGSFVYVVKDGVARVQPVTVLRSVGPETVVETGLSGGEQVVTAGHLQLTDGVRVTVRTPQDRQRKAGA